jgi:hypothetical protein
MCLWLGQAKSQRHGPGASEIGGIIVAAAGSPSGGLDVLSGVTVTGGMTALAHGFGHLLRVLTT